MTSVVVAAIAGVVIGWGVATGTVWVAGAAGAAASSDLPHRARLADHRAAPSATVTTSQAGWEDFHRELARARRHSDRGDRPAAGTAEDAPARASAIVPFVRRIDRVWAEHGDVTLVLPETDRPAAELLVDRIRARRPEAVGDAPAIAAIPSRRPDERGHRVRPVRHPAAVGGRPVGSVARPSCRPTSSSCVPTWRPMPL